MSRRRQRPVREREEDDPLAELYEDLPPEELIRQGRQHLEGRADAQAIGARTWLWRIVRAGLIGGVFATVGFIGYLLWHVHVAGQQFAAVREAVIKAYTDDDGGGR